MNNIEFHYILNATISTVKEIL